MSYLSDGDERRIDALLRHVRYTTLPSVIFCNICSGSRRVPRATHFLPRRSRADPRLAHHRQHRHWQRRANRPRDQSRCSSPAAPDVVPSQEVAAQGGVLVAVKRHRRYHTPPLTSQLLSCIDLNHVRYPRPSRRGHRLRHHPPRRQPAAR